jgi:hypothetical protein
MKRVLIYSACFLVLAVFLMSFVSAGMHFSQPAELYNIGDDFSVDATVIPSVNTNDFFIAKLVCLTNYSYGEKEIYRSSYSVKDGEQKVVTISGKFENFLVGDLSGRCFFRTNYGWEQAESRAFDITRKINLNIEPSEALLLPGQSFNVSGKAIKENGQLSDGYVDVGISEIELSNSVKLESGVFNLNFVVPESAPAGMYNIEARVYERESSGRIKNYGEAVSAVRIKQVVRKADIAINSESIVPGSELVYRVLLYDQSDKDAVENAEVNIYKPDGNIFEKKIVTSGETKSIVTEANYAPGNWKITASSLGIEASKQIYVEELENASFIMINNKYRKCSLHQVCRNINW